MRLTALTRGGAICRELPVSEAWQNLLIPEEAQSQIGLAKAEQSQSLNNSLIHSNTCSAENSLLLFRKMPQTSAAWHHEAFLSRTQENSTRVCSGFLQPHLSVDTHPCSPNGHIDAEPPVSSLHFPRAPLNWKSRRNTAKDTTLAQKPGMLWMMAPLRSRWGLRLRSIFSLC